MTIQHARPLWQRFISAFTALVMVLGMLPFAAQPVSAADPLPPGLARWLAEFQALTARAPMAPLSNELVLGGATTAGNLRVEVHEEGYIGIFRYRPDIVGDEWVTLVYNQGGNDLPEKASRLVYDGEAGWDAGYHFGWADDDMEPGDPGVSVSHTLIGNTIVSVWTAGDTLVTQTVTYNDGDDFIRYDWAIQNTRDSALTDVRFFHGQDTCMGMEGYYCDGASDRGAGLWFPEARAVGVRNVTGGVETRFYLQGITPLMLTIAGTMAISGGTWKRAHWEMS